METEEDRRRPKKVSMTGCCKKVQMRFEAHS
jgi:hypothetical protein